MMKLNASVRDILRDLEKMYEIDVWLDRRLDPDQILDFQCKSMSLEQALESLADRLHAELGWIENVVYLAPKEKIERVETAYWKLFQSWPSNARSPKPLAWKQPSTPSELLELWKNTFKVEVKGEELLPHDLWSERSLRGCTAPASLCLLLSGFDLAASLEGRVVALHPLGEERTVTARLKNVKPNPPENWKKKFPQGNITSRANGSEWLISGPPKLHRESLLTSRKTTAKSDKKVYSLQYRGRLGDLLASLATPDNLNLQWDASNLPKEWLDRMLSLDVEKLTAEKLLEEIGRVSKLSIRAQGNQIQVSEP